MSYLIEWQKQQKALKDAERDRKNNASSMLHNYRGGEHDIKEQKQQKALKDAERYSKMNASSMLHSYRGGEHDIKDQKQQKIIKDAERDSKNNASSMLHNYRGGEHDIKDQKQQKIIKDAERDSKKTASSLLHNYRGGEHDIKDQKQQKIIKDAERDSKQNASSLLHNYRGGEHDIKDYERVIIEERKESHAPDNSGNHALHISGESKNDEEDWHDVKSQKRILTIDFSFGIIYPDFEPKPDADLCASAASVIIPFVVSQWTNDTKILCNPKTPEVIGDVATDDWYEGDGSIRYKVKGKVAVQVFAESSATEAAEGLQKVLRRHVSFRPVSDTEVDKATKEKNTQFIIGVGEQKWMRVREGRLDGLGITF